MIDTQGERRRASPRVSCRWSVKCVTTDKKVFQAKAINISQGGVMMLSPVQFDKGTQLYLEISGYNAGNTQVIQVVGKIAYVGLSTSNEIQIGLQFVSKLSIESNKFLTAYIRNMLA